MSTTDANQQMVLDLLDKSKNPIMDTPEFVDGLKALGLPMQVTDNEVRLGPLYREILKAMLKKKREHLAVVDNNDELERELRETKDANKKLEHNLREKDRDMKDSQLKLKEKDGLILDDKQNMESLQNDLDRVNGILGDAENREMDLEAQLDEVQRSCNAELQVLQERLEAAVEDSRRKKKELEQADFDLKGAEDQQIQTLKNEKAQAESDWNQEKQKSNRLEKQKKDLEAALQKANQGQDSNNSIVYNIKQELADSKRDLERAEKDRSHRESEKDKTIQQLEDQIAGLQEGQEQLLAHHADEKAQCDAKTNEAVGKIKSLLERIKKIAVDNHDDQVPNFDWNKVMAAVDKNDDGNLDLPEFKKGLVMLRIDLAPALDKSTSGRGPSGRLRLSKLWPLLLKQFVQRSHKTSQMNQALDDIEHLCCNKKSISWKWVDERYTDSRRYVGNRTRQPYTGYAAARPNMSSRERTIMRQQYRGSSKNPSRSVSRSGSFDARNTAGDAGAYAPGLPKAQVTYLEDGASDKNKNAGRAGAAAGSFVAETAKAAPKSEEVDYSGGSHVVVQSYQSGKWLPATIIGPDTSGDAPPAGQKFYRLKLDKSGREVARVPSARIKNTADDAGRLNFTA